MKPTHCLAPLLKQLSSLTFVLLLALGCSLSAAQGYPEKPVTIVVGFPPGGTFDVVMRALAEELSKTLGQRFTVDNKAGAGGSIATQAVVAAPADGYTLLTAGLQLGTGPHLQKISYNPQTDLTMVAQVSAAPVLLLVRADSPIKDARDIVVLARKNGNGVSVGSGGVGTTGHFGALMLGSALGVQVVHVPFKGGAPGLQGLVGGEIDMMFDQASGVLQGLVKSGRLRIVSIMQGNRVAAISDIKSAPEFGLTLEVPLRGWQGIAVRSGTPPAVVQKLSMAIAAAVAAPGFKAKIDQLGLELVSNSTPEVFQNFYLAELEHWGRFIKKNQITAQ